jgi:hypothetical protein
MEETFNFPTLTCAHCGETFDAPPWPRIRCPYCGVLGYPDRAGLNLLPLSWECRVCGTVNDGTTNFCLNCGAGLTSRCLRCEGPVYTVVCERCGAHQDRLLRYMAAEMHRATWVPLIRAHAQEQRARPITHEVPPGAVGERDASDRREDRPAQEQGTGREKRRVQWGWVWIVAGVGLLAWSNREPIAAALSTTVTGLDISFATGNAFLGQLQAWWWAFVSSLGRLGELSRDDPEYAYLFATGIFTLALLPVLFLLLRRLIDRLFP